ncbi:MAG: hypothetical protein KBD37_02390 [Burkholderiales bacterium]|nr:hypothetical protein [Burkholderiales bacterium]
MLDPRCYATAYSPHNVIIKTAVEVLNNNLPQLALDNILAELLIKQNDAFINIGLNLSPSQMVSKIIWQSLNNVIALPNSENSWANVFAIPLVLVAGSKDKAKLNPTLDSDDLNNFFIEQQLFNPGFDCFISGKLIDPKTVLAIKPSQLYYWVRNIHQAKLWLPLKVEGSSIEVVNEGVFLRFLVGVSVDTKAGSGLNLARIRDNLNGLMQLAANTLHHTGVTLFPIPFAPVPLSEAFACGSRYRTEIALQVAMSNIVRKIREQRLTPIAKIGNSDEAIKIAITSYEPSDLTETSLWHMTRFDDFRQTLLIITNLLDDIGVAWEYAG